ncbi:MAG: molybdate ABC transporter substrate-binding protein [Methylocella sp.]
MRMLPQILVALFLLAASAHAPLRAESVKVFAAASLKTAIDEINAAWKAKSGDEVLGVYAASPALAKQIEEGAPADIFISADLAWMDNLDEQKLIRSETRANLLTNRLVLIAPKDSGLKLDLKPGIDLAVLLAGGRLAVGETNAVPAGRYAKAALQSLGLWDAVSGHLAEQVNVRAALQLVARGEAPLGIVYKSDAHAETEVAIAGEFPETSHPRIVYPAAIVATSKNPAAPGYFAFLFSEEAAAVFIKNGFSLLKRE